jgi:hypothetical protein
MGISQMLTDVKNHLEQGAELVASHLPVLVEWAEKAEADPLVQTAIDLAVPPSTRTMLATFLKAVEADVAQAQAAAAQAAQQPETPETPEAPAPA